MKRITVFGAGNGGQAFAGYCAANGYEVCLYNRSLERLNPLSQTRTIELSGRISSKSVINQITDSIKNACDFGDILLIVVPATAHRQLAMEMAPYIKRNQTIVLNPGRTLGATEFETELKKYTDVSVNIGEAQTLVFACRLADVGKVNIIGVKNRVPIACTKNSDINCILKDITPIFPCFEKAESILKIGLDNIGSIFHPAVVLFNAATIERQDSFYFYRDMTPQIANVIEALDKERINVGRAYGFDLMSVKDWICYAYPSTKGDSLCERMRNNPAYHNIKAPGSIFTRQLTEDIPTGLLPMRELGRLAKVKTPLMDSIITLVSTLLNVDFIENGRTLYNLGLEGVSKDEIVELIG